MSIATRRTAALRQQGRTRAAVPLALFLTGTLLCASPAGVGQSSGVNQGGPDYLHAPAGMSPMPQQGSSESAMKVEQMRQAERHRHLVTDTAKLVQLSTELKSQIDQSTRDQLSLDAIRKAEEVEKLAHDLKGWLKS